MKPSDIETAKSPTMTGSERECFLDIRIPRDSNFLFKTENSKLNSFFKTSLKSNFTLTTTDKLSQIFKESVFRSDSEEKIRNNYKKLNISFETVCGKILQKNSAFYICIECDKLRKNDSALICILCRECFMNSDHTGHRVVVAKNLDDSSSSCDCGDSGVYDPNGFCGQHAKKDIDLDVLKHQIGEKIFIDLKETLLISFFWLFNLIEIQNLKLDMALSVKLSRMIQMLVEEILNFCTYMVHDINSSFIPMISEILLSNFSTNYDFFLHNCESDQKFNLEPETYNKCTCTVMDLLLKNMGSISDDLQIQLIEFCNLIGKYDPFKKSMAKLYMKHIYSLYYEDSFEKRTTNNLFSKFAKANIHFYTNVDTCKLAVECPYVENLFTLTDKIVINSNEPNSYLIIWELKSILKCLMRPNSSACSKLLTEKHIANKILHILNNLEKEKKYSRPIFLGMMAPDVDINFITKHLLIEGMILGILKRAIIQSFELTESEQVAFKKSIVDEWIKLFQTKSFASDSEFVFIKALERSVGYIIRGPSLRVESEKIRNFLSLIQEDIPEAAKLILKDAVRQFGGLRHIYLIDQKVRVPLGTIYINYEYCLIDTDTLHFQMFIPFMKPDELYEFFVSEWFWFSSDLKDFLLDPKSVLSKEMQNNIEDFLSTIVFLMIDEYSYLNTVVTKDPRDYHEEFDCLDEIQRATKRAIKTIMAPCYWMDFNLVKDECRRLLCETKIEDVIDDLIIKDQKSGKIRLKDQYCVEFDPFLVTIKKNTQRELINMFMNKENKNFKYDPVSGIYYKDLPEFCYNVQNSFFESSLPSTLAKMILYFNPQVNDFIRPVLRLILIHLQSTIHFQETNRKVDLVKENLKFYFDEEFSKKLNEIQDNSSLSDCKGVIEQIKLLLKNLKSGKAEKVEDKDEQKNSALEKKKLAEKKRQEMQELFLQKQKKFQTSIEGKDEYKIDVEENQEDNACLLCRNSIDKTKDSFGTPMFLNFANNLYGMKSNTNAIFAYPVIQGCEHLFHENCFTSWITKSRTDGVSYSHGLNPELETYCPLCKNLSNYFCLLNKTEESKSKNLENLVNVAKKIIPQGVLKKNDGINIDDQEYSFWIILLTCFKFFFGQHTSLSQLKKEIFSIGSLLGSLRASKHDDYPSNLKIISKLEYEFELVWMIVHHFLTSKEASEEFIKDLTFINFGNFLKTRLNVNEANIDSSLSNSEIQEEVKNYFASLLLIKAMQNFIIKNEVSVETEELLVLNTERNYNTLDRYNIPLQIKSAAHYLEDVFKYKAKNLDIEKPFSILSYAPLKSNHIQLPQTYQHFIDKYLKQTCCYCKSISNHGDTVLCLTCGEVMCRAKCSSKPNPGAGNLTTHSANHLSQGIYLEIQSLQVIYMDSPKACLTRRKAFYLNKSGLNIMNFILNPYDKSIDNQNFNDFKLSNDTIQELSKGFESSSIPIELFTHVRNGGKLLVSNVF